ncbi:MAG: energy transducer TonB [Oceanicaulis sp.]
MVHTVQPALAGARGVAGDRGAGGASLRWPLAVLAAAAVTFALFALMQRLIDADVIALVEREPVSRITINFEVDPIDPQPESMGIDQVEPVAPPPAAPQIQARAETPGAVNSVGVYERPVLDPREVLQGQTIAVPPPPMTIRTNPVYPARELGRGVEGDCSVSYDILASGATANIQVVRCDSAAFARASIAAVERWRHAADTTRAPGAVIRRGMVTELNFRLEE